MLILNKLRKYTIINDDSVIKTSRLLQVNKLTQNIMRWKTCYDNSLTIMGNTTTYIITMTEPISRNLHLTDCNVCKEIGVDPSIHTKFIHVKIRVYGSSAYSLTDVMIYKENNKYIVYSIHIYKCVDKPNIRCDLNKVYFFNKNNELLCSLSGVDRFPFKATVRYTIKKEYITHYLSRIYGQSILRSFVYCDQNLNKK